MIVTINSVLTDTSYPKRGYLVFYNDTLYVIDKVQGDKVTLTDVQIRTNTTVDRKVISYCYIKFVAKTTNENNKKSLLFPVIHSAYLDVVHAIYEKKKVSNQSLHEVFKNIVETKEEISVQGKLINIITKAKLNDIVRLTDIKLMDKYELFKDKRLFAVKSVGHNNNPYCYVVEGIDTSYRFVLSRKQFVIINSKDTKTLFTIY